jgi:hypothetical protein
MAAIKNHLMSSVDVDFDTIENLLPSGNRLNTLGEVEDFQETLDDNSERKLVRNKIVKLRFFYLQYIFYLIKCKRLSAPIRNKLELSFVILSVCEIAKI